MQVHRRQSVKQVTPSSQTKVEAVIGTIINRQNLNIAAYPQRGPFARGQAVIATPGNLRGGVLGEYDAHRFGSGTTKLNGAKVNGVLPSSSYVCDQLKAAKDFAVRAGNMSQSDMKALYPIYVKSRHRSTTSSRCHGRNSDWKYAILR